MANEKSINLGIVQYENLAQVLSEKVTDEPAIYQIEVPDVPMDSIYTDSPETSEFGTLFKNTSQNARFNLKFYSPTTSLKNAFSGVKQIKSLNFDVASAPSLSNITDISGMCRGCENLISIVHGWCWNWGTVDFAREAFKDCTSLSTAAVVNFLSKQGGSLIDASSMFRGCTGLTGSLSLNNCTNLVIIDCMFEGCENLESLECSTIKGIRSGYAAFKNCKKLNIGQYNFPTLSNLDDGTSMFENCTSLTIVPGGALHNIKTADKMFKGCTSLTQIDTSNIKDITSAESMFEDCSQVQNINVNGFIYVKNAKNMFKNCTSIENINIAYFINAENIEGMVEGCPKVKTCNISRLDKLINIKNAFNGSNLQYISLGNNYEHLTDFQDAFKGTTVPIYISVGSEYGKQWIADNQVALGIPDGYVCNIFEDGDVIPYSLLDNWIAAQPTDYTVNVTTGLKIIEIPANALAGGTTGVINDSSELSQKLQTLNQYLSVDVTLDIPDDCTSLAGCLAGNTRINKVTLENGKNVCEAPLFAYSSSITDFEAKDPMPIKTMEGAFRNSQLTNLNTRNLSKLSNIKNICSGCEHLQRADLGFIDSNILSSAVQAFQGCIELTHFVMGNLDELIHKEAYGDTLARGNSNYGIEFYIYIKNAAQRDWIESHRADLGIHKNQNIIYNITDVIRYNELESYFLLLTDGQSYPLEVIDIPEAAYVGSRAIDEEGVETVAASPLTQKFLDLAKNCTFDLIIDIPINITNASYCFATSRKIKSLVVRSARGLTNAEGMFYKSTLPAIDALPFEEVTNATRMFAETNITEINTWSLAKVANATEMFRDCHDLTEVNTKVFVNAENISSMFKGCQQIAAVDTTAFGKVTNASSFISGCNLITSIDLSPFTSLATASYMLENTSIEDVDTTALTQLIIADGFFKGTKIKDFDFDNLPAAISLNNFFEDCTELLHVDWKKINERNGLQVENMFLNANNEDPEVKKEITIGTRGERTFIKDNETLMALEQYVIDMPVPAEFEYSEIESLYLTYPDSEVPYDVTILNIPDDVFEGEVEGEIQSPFGQKMEGFKTQVTFNISFEVPETVTSMDACFIGNTKVAGVTITKPCNVQTIQKIVKNNKVINQFDSTNLTAVTNAKEAFAGATIENLNLSGLGNTSIADGIFKDSGFESIDCSVFSQVTSAKEMFKNCKSLTGITQSDTSFSILQNADSMFANCISLNTIDTKNFTSVASAISMFDGCTTLESIDLLNFTNIINTTNMLKSTAITEADLSSLTSLITADSMFEGCANLTSIVFGEINKTVTSVLNMFKDCIADKVIHILHDEQAYYIDSHKEEMALENFIYEIPEANLPTVIPYKYIDLWQPYFNPDTLRVFDYEVIEIPNEKVFDAKEHEAEFNTKLKAYFDNVQFNLKFDIPLATLDLTDSFKDNTHIKHLTITGASPTSAIGFLDGCSSLVTADVSSLTALEDTTRMFKGCSSLKTLIPSSNSIVVNTVSMFEGCSSLETGSLENYLALENAENMFKGCSSLKTIAFSEDETLEKLTNGTGLFDSCTSLSEINTQHFISLVTAKNMFKDCKTLSEIDTSKFDKVTDASSMFEGCTSLENIDMLPFTAVVNADSMFKGSSIKDIDTASFKNVEIASSMFEDCLNITKVNLSGFDFLNKVVNTDNMFKGSKNLFYIFASDINLLDNTSKTYLNMFKTSEANTLYFITTNESQKVFLTTKKDILGISSLNINTVPYDKLSDYLNVILVADTYELTVTDIPDLAIIGNKVAHTPSEFGEKLMAVPEGTLFTLSFGVSDSAANMTSCFDSGSDKIVPLKSVNVIKAFGMKNISYAYNNIKTLTSVVNNALGSVEIIEGTFKDCSGLEEIDTSVFINVTNGAHAFENCTGCKKIATTAFENILNTSYMFAGCTSLNKTSTSTFGKVTDASFMYKDCTSLSEVFLMPFENVVNVESMLENCPLLTSLNFDSLKKVVNAKAMCKNDIGLTDVNIKEMLDVKDTTSMFEGCEAITDAEIGYVYKGVETFTNMFFTKPDNDINFRIRAYSQKMWLIDNSVELGLSNLQWEVIYLDPVPYWHLPEYVPILDPKLNILNVSKVADNAFEATETTQSEFNKVLQTNVREGVTFDLTFDIPEAVTSIDYAFMDNDILQRIHFSAAPNVVSAVRTFKNCDILTDVNTDTLLAVKNTEGMFEECIALKETDTIGLIAVENSTSMYEGCTSLKTVKNIVSMSEDLTSNKMFKGCTSLENISCMLNKVTSAKEMFMDCTSLTTVDPCFNALLDATSMFENCEVLPLLTTQDFLVLQNANRMFFNCKKINKVLTNTFTTVTSSSSMFEGCETLSEIIFKPFLTSDEYIDRMFARCTSLVNIDWGATSPIMEEARQEPVTGPHPKADNYRNMFEGCTSHLMIAVEDEIPVIWISWRFEELGLDKDNLDFIIDEAELPIVIPYRELWMWTKIFKWHRDPIDAYPVTVIEIPSEAFAVTEENGNSPFAKQLAAFYDFVLFDLKFTVPDDISSLYSCFRDDIHIAKITPIGIDKIVNTSYMCYNTQSLYQFDGSFESVIDASYMFAENQKLVTLATETFTSLQNASHMFENCKSLVYSNCATLKEVLDSTAMFKGCTGLATIATSDKTTGNRGFINTLEAESMFEDCSYVQVIDATVFEKINSIKKMFKNCKRLGAIDTSSFDNVTIGTEAFMGCISLLRIDTSHFEKLLKAESMFEGCTELDQVDLSHFIDVEDASRMFVDNLKIETVNLEAFENKAYDIFTHSEGDPEYPPRPDSHYLTKATSMFEGCASLRNVTLGFTYHELGTVDVLKDMFKTTVNNNITFNIKALSEKQWLLRYQTDLGISHLSFHVIRLSKLGYDFLDEYLPILDASGNYWTFEVNQLKKEYLVGKVLGDTKDFEEEVIPHESPLGNKLTMLSGPGAMYNLSFYVPSDCTDTHACFYNNKRLYTLNILNETGITDTRFMFYGNSPITDITTIAFKNVVEAESMFDGCKKLGNIITTTLGKVVTAKNMFRECRTISVVDSSVWTNVVNAFGMFENCVNLASIDTVAFGKVETADRMFYGCERFTYVDTLPFISIKTVDEMFMNCKALARLDFQPFTDITSTKSLCENDYLLATLTSMDHLQNVKYAQKMFKHCHSLPSILLNPKDLEINQDVDIYKYFVSVEDATEMFAYCTSITLANIRRFVKLLHADRMFQGCSSLEEVTVDLIYRHVKDFDNMFRAKADDSDEEVYLLFHIRRYTERYWILTNLKKLGVDKEDCKRIIWPDVPYHEVREYVPIIEDPECAFNIVDIPDDRVENIFAAGPEGIEIAFEENDYWTKAQPRHYDCAEFGVMFRWFRDSEDFLRYRTDLDRYRLAINFIIPDVPQYNKTDRCFKNLGDYLGSVNIADAGDITSSIEMFFDCNQLTFSNTNVFIGSKYTMSMYERCFSLQKIDTAPFLSAENADRMFAKCGLIELIDSSAFKNQLVSANEMFWNCNSLEFIETTGFESVKYAAGMFEECDSLMSVDLSYFKSIVDASRMLRNCRTLNAVTFGTILNSEDPNEDGYYKDDNGQTHDGILNMFEGSRALSYIATTVKGMRFIKKYHERMGLYLEYVAFVSDIKILFTFNKMRAGWENTIVPENRYIRGYTDIDGKLNLRNSQYMDAADGALNLNNSNIYNINGLHFAKTDRGTDRITEEDSGDIDNPFDSSAEYIHKGAEGLQFDRLDDDKKTDSVWDDSNGGLFYSPNRTFDNEAEKNRMIESKHFNSSITSGFVDTIYSKNGNVNTQVLPNNTDLNKLDNDDHKEGYIWQVTSVDYIIEKD